MIKRLYIYIFLFCGLNAFSLDDANFDEIIRITATANVHGEIDPCGWKKKPLGGLARKATVLDTLSKDIDDLIVVDAGNLFFKKDIVEVGLPGDISKINSKIILDAFNEMGCNAFSPGTKDFAAGKDYLMSLRENASFPFVSANIYNKETNQLLFPEYVMVEANDRKIAFIGLTSIFQSDGITVKNPIEELKKLLESNKINADLVVLLFSSTDQDMNALYKEKFDIDMVLRSHSTKRSSDGGNKVLTYALGDRGKLVYSFDLYLKSENNVNLVDVNWCNNTIDRYQNRLDRMKEGKIITDLDQLYKDDPSTMKKINRYRDYIKEAQNKLSSAEDILIMVKHELDKKVIDKIDILKIVDEGKLQIKELAGPGLPDHKGRLPGDPHYNHGH